MLINNFKIYVLISLITTHLIFFKNCKASPCPSLNDAQVLTVLKNGAYQEWAVWPQFLLIKINEETLGVTNTNLTNYTSHVSLPLIRKRTKIHYVCHYTLDLIIGTSIYQNFPLILKKLLKPGLLLTSLFYLKPTQYGEFIMEKIQGALDRLIWQGMFGEIIPTPSDKLLSRLQMSVELRP